MVPVLGACTEVELVLVEGVGQFPNRDFTDDCAEACVVVMEPVEAAPVDALVKPGKTDGAAVVLLVDPPNIDALLKETVDVALVVVRDGGCPKLPLAAVLSNMGLKFCTRGLLSGADVAEAVVTAKMGLNPEARRGFVVLTACELLTGAAVAVTMLETVETEGVLIWLERPNRPVPATGGVLLEDLETWPKT